MTDSPGIPDLHARRLAETTFDRNVVVIAGAGTGKTTLLANRLVHALVREPDPIPITQIVALTFTNKAATEMKLRLRERLVALTRAGDGSPDGGAVSVVELRERYRLSSDEIIRRAEAALADLEKAQIGTLHSFAAHLLRLYPIESGVDPDFREDDETGFREYFLRQWQRWLDVELDVDGPHHAEWREALALLSLDALRELAYALSSDLIPLDVLSAQIADRDLSPSLARWIAMKRDRAAALLAHYDRPRRRNAEWILEASVRALTLVLEQGVEGLVQLDEAARDALGKELGQPPAGWTDEDFEDCESLLRIGKGLLRSRHAALNGVLALLSPFVERVRAGFVEEGAIRFDGLLAKAGALLRDHPALRERIKRDYRAIMIDEFQDTDPTQYEIVLYLAEQPGRCRHHWRDIALAPGKLFIVGDPKQSIYAFRRADIEAFDQVVQKIVASGGAVYTLMTNFRSDGAVLTVVNACFDRLLRQKPNVQPPNVTLLPRPGRPAALQTPGVLLRLVRPEETDADFDSEGATRAEAESLAAWLKEEVLGRERLIDRHGQMTALQPGQVALLFRKLTQAQEYLDALRRHGIEYVTDGEKHFFRRQEVIDLINVVRIVENPLDAIAMTGVLRSPLGGLTDREVYEVREVGAYDYREPERLAAWSDAKADCLRGLYGRLRELRQHLATRPLPELFDAVFERLPVLELAAASLHGEQAVANLLKVRDMAAAVAGRPHLTLSGFVDLMIEQLAEQPEEAEGALAEESSSAVRILTIHKAKGLEFPVVILPGLHHGSTNGRDARPVVYDWATGVAGLTIGESMSLGALLIAEKARECEEAERRRLFYVGMTRARERLVLSGALVRRSARTFLALLKAVAGEDAVGEADQPEVRFGDVPVRQLVMGASDRTPRARRDEPVALSPSPDCAAFLKGVEEREHRWKQARQRQERLTATSLAKAERRRRRGRTTTTPGRARAVGVAVHRVLEQWDFAQDPAEIGEALPSIVAALSSSEPIDDAPAVIAEAREVLSRFAVSAAYDDLRRAEILGREVPFLMPWSATSPQPSLFADEQSIMDGVIDLLVRRDGALWVIDYKTDEIESGDAERHAARYRVQADVYREAVSRCFAGSPVRFQLIFLRAGIVVEL